MSDTGRSGHNNGYMAERPRNIAGVSNRTKYCCYLLWSLSLMVLFVCALSFHAKTLFVCDIYSSKAYGLYHGYVFVVKYLLVQGSVSEAPCRFGYYFDNVAGWPTGPDVEATIPLWIAGVVGALSSVLLLWSSRRFRE